MDLYLGAALGWSRRASVLDGIISLPRGLCTAAPYLARIRLFLSAWRHRTYHRQMDAAHGDLPYQVL